MQLTVKGKQLDVGDALRSHVDDSLSTVVGKYFSKPIEADVLLSRDAHLFKADIQVHVGRGMVVHAVGDATEPYPAFDAACEKIAKRLRRMKRRLRDHHNGNGNGNGISDAGPTLTPARYQILEAEEQDNHVEDDNATTDAVHAPIVVAEMETSIATLTVSDAVLRLELTDQPAVLFKNSAHGGINLVYRRADGNIGWVDPAETAGA